MSDEKLLTQEHVNYLVGQARDQGKELGAREAKEAATKEFADQIKELGEQVELYKTKHEETMNGALESAVSGLSDEAKKMVEDFPGDVDAKIAWIETYKDLLKTKSGGDRVGNRPTPPRKTSDVKSEYKSTPQTRLW